MERGEGVLWRASYVVAAEATKRERPAVSHALVDDGVSGCFALLQVSSFFFCLYVLLACLFVSLGSGMCVHPFCLWCSRNGELSLWGTACGEITRHAQQTEVGAGWVVWKKQQLSQGVCPAGAECPGTSTTAALPSPHCARSLLVSEVPHLHRWMPSVPTSLTLQ